MWTSPKRYIRDSEDKIVEFQSGLSGTLVVAEGGQLTVPEAIKLGLMQDPKKPSSEKQPEAKPWEAPAPTSEGTALPLETGTKVAETIAAGFPKTLGSAPKK